MQLIVVRHGEADLVASSDRSRRLNENGTLESELIGRWVAKQCKLFDYVLVSPFDRAVQTWQEIALQGINAKELVFLSELEPEANVESCINLIHGYCDQSQSVLVVSHLPLVCHLVDGLVAESCPLFVTGGAALIELDDSQVKGRLLQMITPEQAIDTSAIRL